MRGDAKIAIPDLSMKIERPVIPDDPKKSNRLARIADENRPTMIVSESRPAKNGDVVVIDFVGRIDERGWCRQGPFA